MITRSFTFLHQHIPGIWLSCICDFPPQPNSATGGVPATGGFMQRPTRRSPQRSQEFGIEKLVFTWMNLIWGAFCCSSTVVVFSVSATETVLYFAPSVPVCRRTQESGRGRGLGTPPPCLSSSSGRPEARGPGHPRMLGSTQSLSGYLGVSLWVDLSLADPQC